MRIAAAILSWFALCSVSRAADERKDSITVLPWTNATLVFGTSDKTGVVEYIHLSGTSDRMLYLKAAAPVDKETRIGAFTGENRLASGFSGTLQFGLDERAAELRRLRDLYLSVRQASEDLVAAEVPIQEDELKAYIRRHGIREDADAISRFLCTSLGQANCTPEVVARAVCQQVSDRDDLCPEATITDAATKVAREALPACAAMPGDARETSPKIRDQCFLAKFWLNRNQETIRYRKILDFVVQQETIQKIWSVLELVDEKRAQELLKKYGPGGKAQALLDEKEAVSAAFKGLLGRSKLALRDLLLTGVLAKGAKSARSITIDGNVTYDHLEVYRDDLAAKVGGISKYQTSLGLNATYYPIDVTGTALNFRLGYSLAREPKAKKTERCLMRTSSDPAITGRSCQADALFLAGEIPDARSSAYLRAAATYQYVGERAEDDLVPGIELRGGLEGLGADRSATARLTLFGTPIKGTAAARVGIALDLAYAIDRDLSEERSRWTVTPLFFLGASFTDLMGAN